MCIYPEGETHERDRPKTALGCSVWGDYLYCILKSDVTFVSRGGGSEYDQYVYYR